MACRPESRAVLATIASLSAGRPPAGVYRCIAGWRQAAIGRLDDVVRRREVRLAGAEADHRLAGGLEGLGLRVDREGRRLGDRGDAAGDAALGGRGRRRAADSDEETAVMPPSCQRRPRLATKADVGDRRRRGELHARQPSRACPRSSNSRSPPPRRTGTTTTWSSSSRPARRYCCTVAAPPPSRTCRAAGRGPGPLEGGLDAVGHEVERRPAGHRARGRARGG